MSINLEIARIFYEIADILEIKKVRWKPAAYRMAAQTLESLKEDVSEIYRKKGPAGIDRLPGVGSSLTSKIIQYIQEKKISEHEKLKKTLPSGLYKMMDIPGVGPKKALLFYNKLGIKDIPQLQKAAQEQKLRSISGFKEQTEKNILESISRMNANNRIPLSKARKIASSILKELKKIPYVRKAIAAGSLRRRKPTVGDLDIVVLTDKSEKVTEKIVKMKFVNKILGKGKEKATIITKQGLQIDFRFFNEDGFGSGLLYFTGSKQYNISLREIAMKKGLKLNEYGLFKGSEKIAGRTEKEVFEALGLKFVPPEKRP
jgi:DNA polymerase (family 10)